MNGIKRSELQHFSRLGAQTEVLALDNEKKVELIESAFSFLYCVSIEEREKLLGLIQAVLQADEDIADQFLSIGYTVCDRKLSIRYVNDVYLDRSGVTRNEMLGRSLYYEREYEGTQLERLYSMVMETRLTADAVVRYKGVAHSKKAFDGWFIVVILPLEEGGIGIVSKFTDNREEIFEAPEGSGPTILGE